MSEVFISYKREDEARVGWLVQGYGAFLAAHKAYKPYPSRCGEPSLV